MHVVVRGLGPVLHDDGAYHTRAGGACSLQGYLALLQYVQNVDHVLAVEHSPDETDELLEAIAARGAKGVRTHKGVRALVKANAKSVDSALVDLLKTGSLNKVKYGRA